MNFRRLTIAVAAGLLLSMGGAPAARGATLVQYDFSSGKFPNLVGSNVFAGNFTYDEEILGTNLGPSVGNLPPSLGAITYYKTIGEARQTDSYRYTHTLTPAAGYALSLDSIRVDVSAYALQGVSPYTAQLAVFSSLDNFLNPVYFNFATDLNGTDSAISPWSTFTNTAVAANPLYQNVTAPITFHYYTFGSALSGIFIDNPTFTGTVTAVVPEPARLSLLALSTFALLRRVRPSAP